MLSTLVSLFSCANRPWRSSGAVRRIGAVWIGNSNSGEDFRTNIGDLGADDRSSRVKLSYSLLKSYSRFSTADFGASVYDRRR
jgi:hypothetical protein